MASSLLDTNDGSSLFDRMPAPGAGAQVYIMRHGATAMDMGSNRSDGWLDLPLTDEGRVELIQAQQMLKCVPLKVIYVPDLKRTIETGEIVASGTASDPTVVEVAQARTWNLGIIAGMKKEDGRPKVKDLKLNPTRKPPGGESYSEFKTRFLAWLLPLMAKQEKSKQPVLLVLSGSTLRLIGLEYFDSEDDCDLAEGGLAALHYDGDWECEVLLGHEDASPWES
jgi:broad specificity phosphatase PhoE